MTSDQQMARRYFALYTCTTRRRWVPLTGGTTATLYVVWSFHGCP